MGQFAINAANILAAAEAIRDNGEGCTDFTIMVGSGGDIHLIADSDWSLDALQAHHGARMVYRVSHPQASLRVEGRSGTSTLRFDTEPLKQTARRLLPDSRQYRLAESPITPVLLPVRIWPIPPAASD